MPGATNQIQTPFGSGVPMVLNLAPGVAGGISQLPANPGISYTGTLYGALFTVWQDATISLAGYATPIIVANYDNTQANGAGNDLNSLTTINLGAIQQLNNGFTGAGYGTITSFVANSLIQVNSDFNPTFQNATTVSLPALQYVGGTFSGSYNVITTFSLPALIAVNNNFSPTPSPVSTTLTAPNLTYVGNSFSAIGSAITTVDFSSLQYVGGLFNPQFTLVTTLNLPAIVRIIAAISLTACPALATFSLGSTLKQVGNNVIITGAALSQASVDGVLVSLAALDGTNGTTAWSSLTVDMSGGSSATPGATGLAAKATLVGRGCTVTTN